MIGAACSGGGGAGRSTGAAMGGAGATLNLWAPGTVGSGGALLGSLFTGSACAGSFAGTSALAWGDQT